MKTKIKIKSVFGSVLFELEKENNSVKDTLIEAVNNGANLGGADIRDAYLGGANLEAQTLDTQTLVTQEIFHLFQLICQKVNL